MKPWITLARDLRDGGMTPHDIAKRLGKRDAWHVKWALDENGERERLRRSTAKWKMLREGSERAWTPQAPRPLSLPRVRGWCEGDL